MKILATEFRRQYPQEPLHPITQEAESIDLEIPDAIDGTEFCSTESLIGLQDVARH